MARLCYRHARTYTGACPQCKAEKRGRDAHYDTPAWRATRALVKRRDGNACTQCGRTGVRLDVDHIVPRSMGGTDHPSNLRTLCVHCHSKRRK